MDGKKDPGLARRALGAALRFIRGERPEAMKGLKGVWLAISCGIIICVLLTLVLGLCGEVIWAGLSTGCAVALLLLSNLWFRERVTNPILGLGDTARRIADGSYGSLAEKLRDDEIGRFVDAFNDMSVKIGEAGRTQSEFISSVSHELRTPLTAITGWSETLMYDEAIQGDSRRGVEIISAEAGRLTGMVEELLEFTRIRDGRFTLNLREVELELLLEEVDFTYGELLRHDGLELVYEPSEEPLLPVTGDPARLKQVLLNILDNAAKYGRRGRLIELKAWNEGEYVKVRVRDHGPGFAEEDLPHVKERFYKGRGKERGSGIGLAVCDEIVTRHRGRLTVGNCEDGGALVTAELPVKTQCLEVKMSEKNNDRVCFRTMIGGQALIEGIMMRGPDKQAIVCRTKEGLTEKVEPLKLAKDRHPALRWPFIRGLFIFVDSMLKGMKALSYSASLLPEDEQEEPTKFDLWLEKKIGSEKAEKFIIGVAAFLGVCLAVGLFLFLPTLIAGFIPGVEGHYTLRSLLEGAVKIVIFLVYLWLCSRMKDMKRLFAYHGAEHKTIFCYEKGLELTVENVRPQSRFHPRCGTSFLLVVIVLGIFVGLFIQIDNTLLRFALRLLLLPVIVCVAYELNRWAGRHDRNIISRAFTWPGRQLQHLTTNEPDDGMIECAIRAMELVIPEEKGKDAW